MPRLRHRLLAACAAALFASAIVGCGEGAGSTSVVDVSQPSPSETTTPKTKPSKKPKSGPSASPSVKPTGSATAGKQTRIVFVNVGQGDAILVQSGSHEMLIDGGPGGSAGRVEAAARKAGIKDLDLVVVSHMHADHIGATDDLVYAYDPERALIAGSCDGSLRNAFSAVGTKVRQTRRGDSFTLGSVKARVLSPKSVSGEANEDSVVLLLDVAGRRILLTGDITGPKEAAVGAICARGPPLYLLKVAHHGSRYSTSSSFLDETDPRFAVICVGPNSYGHPTPETLARLKAEGTRIYSTQKNGTITVTISASGAVKWQFGKSSRPVSRAGKSSGGTSSTTPGSSSGRNPIVYITETGECYHRDGCRYLSHSRIPVRLKDAKAQGYRPCSVCDPPR